MSADPRILIVALEDLLQELGLWSSAAVHTLGVGYNAQRQARENAERGFHQASIVLNEAQSDQEHINQLLSDLTPQLAQCEAGKISAHDTLSEAQNALNESTYTLEFWEEELREALAWLARAEARLARAIDEYERARSAFERAKWNLERAESRYRACMNDRNRSNCNSEARAVNAF